jgi:hypothetical protein
MALRKIDVYAPFLSQGQSDLLIKMLDKREYYVEQCRPREAHGAGTMIMMLWAYLSDYDDTMPFTGMGELN